MVNQLILLPKANKEDLDALYWEHTQQSDDKNKIYRVK